jgi:hypothetical protein
MAKMISDPEDKNPGKGYKPEKLGSDIRVDGKRLRDDQTTSVGKAMPDIGPMIKRMKAESEAKEEDSASRMNAMGDTYKKGGMTASKRADGIAQRGKTRGTMIMCGGGMTRK